MREVRMMKKILRILPLFLIAALCLIVLCAYMLFRPYKEATTLSDKAVA